MSELIGVDTPPALAIPQQNRATVPMKKYTLRSNLTLLPTEFDFFGDLTWDVYDNRDPNAFFSEEDIPISTPVGTRTRIHMHYQGFYAITCRWTAFPHDPLVQNGTAHNDFYIYVSGARALPFRWVSVARDMLGKGTWPTGSSSALWTGTCYNYYPQQTTYIEVSCAARTAFTIAGGTDHHRYTYLQICYLGSLDLALGYNAYSHVNPDPYYGSQNQALSRTH